MKQHYVEFYSPGTFFHETRKIEIDSWDVDKAVEIAGDISERYGARPFGFKFITREREDSDLDAKVTDTSGTYFLGGKLLTLEDVTRLNVIDPKNYTDILVSNMEMNDVRRVVENRNSYRSINTFIDGDTLLDVALPGVKGNA